eukprot:jgi/Chrzof1/3545/UNPLg00754.t1
MLSKCMHGSPCIMHYALCMAVHASITLISQHGLSSHYYCMCYYVISVMHYIRNASAFHHSSAGYARHIAGGIANVKTFANQPEVYAYGMLCNLAVGGIFQGIASYLHLNVSATHSIIGGILGFSMPYGGAGAVNWATPDPGSFPPYTGALPVILSWFVSPVLTGLAACILFLAVRFLVLRRKDAYDLSFWVLPPFVPLTTWINIFFVFTKGAKKTLSENDDWDTNKSAWVAAIIAAGLATLTAVVVLPIMRLRAKKHFSDLESRQKDAEAAIVVTVAPESPNWSEDKGMYLAHMAYKALMHGVEQDIHAIVEEDATIKAIHEHAEQFDPKVFSAVCVIFAHGANEVGYMTGPLSTIYTVYETGSLPSKVAPPIWIIIISAIGLVFGLATYGYNVTRAVGRMMAKLSPTRGFACELATALVIMVASQ